MIRVGSRDEARLLELFRAIEAEEWPGRTDAPDLAEKGFGVSRESFDFLSSDSFWLLGAELDGKLVSYASVVRIPKADARRGTLYIDELYVLRAHRRQGLASALLGAVHQLARDLRFWRIRLNADPDDTAVRAFYESLGYHDNGDGFFQRDV